jgi:hypothetical protein
MLNHQTSKISPTSFWSQTLLRVLQIRGFECGIGIFKRGGPLHSTGAGMLNHQTSKISPTSFWSQFSLWVLKIRGFECGNGVFKRGAPLNSTGVGMLNHQTSKISPILFWSQISLWMFKIRGFEGGIGISKRGDQGCHVDDNGRTDGRTMAAGASVTWTHCSVLFEVTWGKTLASVRMGSVQAMARDYIRGPQTFHSHFLHRLCLEKLRCVWCTSWSGLR